ncbi:subtilisin-like protease SBT4.3 [Impatiens glandulifera]|uniref:subtilisin-like protease SBT4.3 n=1 Tax=Impatiens glandulifera TaxID=253017 RepID=UPI001FB054BB|nr:subtilisin-like protease SBT4.3 [Impatiens glandulifera]
MKEVISVFPNKINHILTTRSWNFIGFPQTVKREKMVESDIIIGVLDTGIWPESNSFIDEGFGPPPSKWKGSCEGLTNFTCNNKIIGARYYKKDKDFEEDEIESPRDTDGHGTHVASIIAGGLVSTSFYGLANGTARGGVPSSRIAVYKVCWSSGCLYSDIMTAFDDAINDGVDIISYSLGGNASDYFNDAVHIGSFHAMTKGILTTMAGGNNGPEMGTIGNISPWALTVASSRTNRKFITNLKLGDGTTLEGISVNTFDPNGFPPIVYGANVKKKGFCFPSVRFCLSKSLNPGLVKGKIIVYDELNTGEEALMAGAVGMVVIRENISSINANIFSLPTTLVGGEDGRQILNYINRTRNATANIMKSYEIVDEFAPYISPDSSRGPNTLTFGILKPDLSAPGDNILAAWTLANSPTNLIIDRRRVPYSIQSGTSMACPHVSAAAAYVKSFNPLWSPSAIKSALMTTAFTMNPMTTLEQEFGYGAGLINPIAAIDPGLVYDANKEDYVMFLCSLGYTNQQMQHITGDNSTCNKFVKQYVWNLNLPSFCSLTLPLKKFKVTFLRKVTNVGLTPSTYNVKIDSSEKLKIQVFPDTLSFTHVGQTQSFTVTVEGIISRSTMAEALPLLSLSSETLPSPISFLYPLNLSPTAALLQVRSLSDNLSIPSRRRPPNSFVSRQLSCLQNLGYKEVRSECDMLRHPADSYTWKTFDEKYKNFASDPCSVRLGPKNPGDAIDIFLQPLIEELTELLHSGVRTFDAHTKKYFNMRAALLWIINDFPAYANLSGWSTKGKLACPCCNKDTISLRLVNWKKQCYMGHRRFLPPNHKYRRDKESFDGRTDYREPSKMLTGQEIYEQARDLEGTVLTTD